MRIVDEDKASDLPKGWKNWSSDPTMHFLMLVNPRWLDARRKVLKQARPAWEKPPTEIEGSAATEDVLLVLESALIINAKQGHFGIDELDLPSIPGLEDIRLPLAAPPEDSAIIRVRLPGRGTNSQWTYTLKGKLRLKYQADYSVKRKLLKKPVAQETEALPAKMIRTKEEKARVDKDLDKKLAGAVEKDLMEKIEAQESVAGPMSPEGISKKPKKTAWKKLESSSNPGNFYYFNAETNESSIEKPAGFEEEVIHWERITSKSNPGECYYYNRETGQSQADRPPAGTPVKNDLPSKKASEKTAEDDEEPKWQRVGSESKPGHFYYHNTITGKNEIDPPRVTLPWKLVESSSKKGQFYYYNEMTKKSSEHPPNSAIAAGAKRPAPANQPAAEAVKKPRSEKIPAGWEKKESSSNQGKFYYQNIKTKETKWERPVWEKKESSSNPGSFYFTHVDTGETVWKEPKQ